MAKRSHDSIQLIEKSDTVINKIYDADTNIVEQMRGRWCYLTDNISPTALIQQLAKYNLAGQFNDDTGTSRLTRTVAILLKVYKKVETGDADYFRLFKRCLEDSDPSLFQRSFNFPVAKANFLWSVTEDTCDKYKTSLQDKKPDLIDALAKDDSIIRIANRLFESFIFEFKDLDELFFAMKRQPVKKSAEMLIDKVIVYAEKGSYQCLLEAWKDVSSLNQALLTEMWNKAQTLSEGWRMSGRFTTELI